MMDDKGLQYTQLIASAITLHEVRRHFAATPPDVVIERAREYWDEVPGLVRELLGTTIPEGFVPDDDHLLAILGAAELNIEVSYDYGAE